MRKSRATFFAAVAASAALVLSGCAGNNEEDLGAIDEVGDTNILDAISEELTDVDTVVADAKDLFFDTGFYSFTYTETALDKAMTGEVSSTGVISFRDDGSCAFEAQGVQSLVDVDIPFTFVKNFTSTATLRLEGEAFDRVDPTEYEPLLGLKLSPLGPFPRSADFAGFCGLQSMSEYVERAERAPGTGAFNREKADGFVEKQLDVFYKDMYEKLGITDYTENEARDIVSRMYVGSEIMPVWDLIIEFGTDPETGVVTIRNGIPGETNYAEMIMTPLPSSARELNLEYVQDYSVTWDQQLDFFLEVYGSGDEYIKSRSGE